ncbi:MAG: disulfide bond formation protein B [Gammaproteobacteria bacterium]|nr:disulfide bond formation protein B [Gammaproteobacteria bacterium]
MKAPRLFYLILALGCASLLGYGYYLQFVDGLEPCPLCIFQRIAYIGIIIISFIGLIHGPGLTGIRLYSGLLSITSLTGAGIAARQVWLQHLPPGKVPECGPDLEYMMEVFSFAQTLQKVFTGSGECAVVDWTFLGLSIAEWSLLCFLGLACLCFIHTLRGRINNWL